MKLTLTRLVLFVIAAWAVTPYLVSQIVTGWTERGQFGDIFGAVNALFSGLAFAGLFWSLRLQQEQLQLQRTELSLQREELKLQRDEMAASRAELVNQVRAQEALFRAANGQIAVASVQARVQAAVLEAESIGPGGRSHFVTKIQGYADEIETLCKVIGGKG